MNVDKFAIYSALILSLSFLFFEKIRAQQDPNEIPGRCILQGHLVFKELVRNYPTCAERVQKIQRKEDDGELCEAMIECLGKEMTKPGWDKERDDGTERSVLTDLISSRKDEAKFQFEYAKLLNVENLEEITNAIVSDAYKLCRNEPVQFRDFLGFLIWMVDEIRDSVCPEGTEIYYVDEKFKIHHWMHGTKDYIKFTWKQVQLMMQYYKVSNEIWPPKIEEKPIIDLLALKSDSKVPKVPLELQHVFPKDYNATVLGIGPVRSWNEIFYDIIIQFEDILWLPWAKLYSALKLGKNAEQIQEIYEKEYHPGHRRLLGETEMVLGFEKCMEDADGDPDLRKLCFKNGDERIQHLADFVKNELPKKMKSEEFVQFDEDDYNLVDDKDEL